MPSHRLRLPHRPVSRASPGSQQTADRPAHESHRVPSQREMKSPSKKSSAGGSISGRLPKVEAPAGATTDAAMDKLAETMLADVEYEPDQGVRRGRPPYHITMRIYTGVEVSDTLEIRSDDAGSLHFIRDFAERHDVWVESSTVRDPELDVCHRLWIVDDPLHPFLSRKMLPRLFMRLIEQVLGYERDYAGNSMWMFERRKSFRKTLRQRRRERDRGIECQGRSSEDC